MGNTEFIETEQLKRSENFIEIPSFFVPQKRLEVEACIIKGLTGVRSL